MARFYIDLPNGKKIWLDGLLKTALDSVIYNIKHNKSGDWDCMIIISGDRMVGTGKSTLAALIGTYLAYRLEVNYSIKDIYFNSDELIDEAIKKPKFSIDHYDEARRGLVSTKRMQKVQEDLLDYFAECRQLNHVMILVLPDYFTLNEEIAVARSEFLINVYRGEKKKSVDLYNEGSQIPIVEWDRGYFSLFNRIRKAILYDKYKNTRKKNYFAVKANFNSYFDDFGLLGKEYEEKKLQALQQHRKKNKETLKPHKADVIRNKIILDKYKEGKATQLISDELEQEYGYSISQKMVWNIINHEKTLTVEV